LDGGEFGRKELIMKIDAITFVSFMMARGNFFKGYNR
jgi:hypothetical protein